MSCLPRVLQSFVKYQNLKDNKSFIESTKSKYKSNPDLKSWGTVNEYVDFIAKVESGILKSEVNLQIKPGVAELFESNPELAQSVYKALGFQGNISLESNLKNTGKTEQELTEYLQQKYPEIKLNITNNPVWETNDNVFNQKEFNNQVQYRLKATKTILDNLLKIKQWESNKSINQETLYKKIQELGISKQQIDLLKKSEGNTVEEKLTSFVAKYSYTVEINTTKEGGIQNTTSETGVTQTTFDFEDFNYVNVANQTYHKRALRNVEVISEDIIAENEEDISKYMEEYFGIIGHGTYNQSPEEFKEGEEILQEMMSYTEDGKIKLKNPNSHTYKKGDYIEISEEEFKKVQKNAKSTPTQYYSNLSVPGGTNYTENEIATPDITPSIKGHAKFSTPNGIGWFRSDESQQNQNIDVQNIISDLQKSGQLEINCK